MKDVFTDYIGNVVEFHGSRNEAIDQGLNINCTGCTCCTGCIGCDYCTGCTCCNRCTDCTDCDRCNRCTGCIGCAYCADCTCCNRCTDCTDCTECDRCTHCTRCKIQPVCIISQAWMVCIRTCKPTIKIGCQDHSVDEWMSFSDEQISKMHSDALAFWKQWKPIIQAVIASRNN
jgi:hypothetical protein